MIIRTDDASMPFAFKYDAQEWAAMVAAFPIPLADTADPEAECQGLEYVATAYLNLSHHHRIRAANGFPTKRWQNRRRQIARDLAEAEHAGKVDELPALREALRYADAAVAAYGTLGKVRQRRGDPARDWLYDAALAIWQRLGGALKYTRGSYGRAAPSGPLIEFMFAALIPVMGDAAPGAEALRKRIRTLKRQQQRRGVAKPRAA
jgi:hypothetical protein